MKIEKRRMKNEEFPARAGRLPALTAFLILHSSFFVLHFSFLLTSLWSQAL
jgi:hypothetical protein